MKTILSRIIRGLVLWLQRYEPRQPQQEGLVVPIPLQNEFDRLRAVEVNRLPQVTWRHNCGPRQMSADNMQALFQRANPVELFPLLFASWIFFLQRVPKEYVVMMRYSTLPEDGNAYWVQVKLDTAVVLAVHSPSPLEEFAETLMAIGEHQNFRLHRERPTEKGFRMVTLVRLQPTEAVELPLVATPAT